MKNIPGRLDMASLAALTGTQTSEEARMHHFRCLDYAQQVVAVGRLARAGHPERTIAHATGWSVEMVRRALGEHRTGVT